MNVSDLRIVGNRSDFDENQVKTLALGAFDIWEKAAFFPPDAGGLAQAVAECSLAGGGKRREGERRQEVGV